MPNSNLINISKKGESDAIYRVFSIARLLEFFKTRTNVLVRPRLWDDPFENYILKSTGITKDGDSVSFGFQRDLYGQCWTFERESDAMWRIYSSDRMGVRVPTTIRALSDSLYQQVSRHPEISVFIGKVSYETQKAMVSQLKNRAEMQGVLDTTGQGTVRTLLMKREEFRHEKEVRLVYYNHLKNDLGDLFKYEIDPFTIIDEIVFDPRMNNDLVEVFTQHLRDMTFSGRISKSPLYQLPNLKVSI